VLVGLCCALSGCNSAGSYAPGTPEYAGALIARGYDCALPVQQGRIVSQYGGPDRTRLVRTQQAQAVQSYNRPVACGEAERSYVRSELRAAAR
jgi:hypothetical protein